MVKTHSSNIMAKIWSKANIASLLVQLNMFEHSGDQFRFFSEHNNNKIGIILGEKFVGEVVSLFLHWGFLHSYRS